MHELQQCKFSHNVSCCPATNSGLPVVAALLITIVFTLSRWLHPLHPDRHFRLRIRSERATTNQPKPHPLDILE
jgi:hypothetical protein